jgi:hypothetical protein
MMVSLLVSASHRDLVIARLNATLLAYIITIMLRFAVLSSVRLHPHTIGYHPDVES